MNVEMKPGDIILYGGSRHESLASRLVEAGEIIKTGDDSILQYSHVALWEGHQVQLEATWPRITRSRIDQSRTYDVLRYEGITDAERAKVMDAARRRLGEWYNLLYILTFGLWKIKNMEVCCTYAGDCYEEAGLDLRYATPNELKDDRCLKVIYRWRPR